MKYLFIFFLTIFYIIASVHASSVIADVNIVPSPNCLSKNPCVTNIPSTAAPSTTVPSGSSVISGQPSSSPSSPAAPSQNPSPSSTQPCSTSQSSVSSQSNRSVHASASGGKKHFAGRMGFLQQLFLFLWQLLQLIFQKLGIQLPNISTPCGSGSGSNPSPSGTPSTGGIPSTAPSSTPSTAPQPSGQQPSTPSISLPTACTKTISPGTSITTSASRMAPGGVLCVNGGNYSESVTISKSGSSGQFITIRNATAAMPIITKLTFSTTVSYITFNGFEITGGNDPLVNIPHGAHDINITNNKIHHGSGNGMLNYGNNILVQGNEFTDFANEDAIRFWGDHQTYLNNHIHDIQNAGHNDAFQTWRQTSDLRPPVTNLVVKNNVIQNMIGSNAHCFAVENQTSQVDTNWTISNNTFSNIGAHCLILGDPSHPESGVQKLIISNNKFTTIGGDAIECNGPTTGTLSGNTFSGVGGTQIVNDSGGKCTGQ